MKCFINRFLLLPLSLCTPPPESLGTTELPGMAKVTSMDRWMCDGGSPHADTAVFGDNSDPLLVDLLFANLVLIHLSCDPHVGHVK